MSPPIKRNTCAIIITYHPDSHLPDRILKIKQQVDAVVIIDNNSSEPITHMLEDLTKKFTDVHLILNQHNMGVATALNQGLRWAKEANYSWAVTLDQDTLIPDSMVTMLGDIFNQLEPKETIAMIGSNFRSANSGRIFFKPRGTDHTGWSECKIVITSGSLISLTAYDAIGPFRDDFFIDQVDHEYCLRARKKGFKIIISTKYLIEQPFGTPSEGRLFGKTIYIAHYSPIRYYFLTRNILILSREYFANEPMLILKIISRLIKIYLIVIYGPDKIEKIKNALRGLWDGLRFKSINEI